ncbi:unnamed protein product [Sphagnum balticum]
MSRMGENRMMSQNAVLQSASLLCDLSSNAITSTRKHLHAHPNHRSNRPKSEVISHTHTQSIGVTPLEEENEEVINEPWSKRHTIHESMSYYSLCFPSPPSHNEKTSAITSTNNEEHLLINTDSPDFKTINLDADNDDDEAFLQIIERQKDHGRGGGNNNVGTMHSLPSFELEQSINMRHKLNSITSTEGFNSFSNLTTPNTDKSTSSISHSVSHSSGYQSYTDESLYDNNNISNNTSNHKDFAGVLQSSQAHLNRFNPSVVFRRIPKEINPSFELKPFNRNARFNSANDFTSLDNDHHVPILHPPVRLTKESRARSCDRVSLRRDSGESGVPGCESAGNSDGKTIPWHPAINSIKEIVVPGSPASRKWSYSPAKSKVHQHHWQLCMYVFGGKEQGMSGIYKQPLSIWKLYI